MFARAEARGCFRTLLHVLLLNFLAHVCAFSQPLLVHETSTLSVSIRTFAGPAECTSSPIEPERRLTAAILMDSIGADDFDRVRTELTGLYRGLSAGAPLTLAVLSGRQWQTAGPFRSLPQWRAGLNKLLKPGAATPGTDSAIQLYEFLGASAPQFGTAWSTLLFVGKFPPVDADLRDYAAAYLSSKFRAQRLRVSHWPVTGESSELWDDIAAITGGVSLRGGLDELPQRLAHPPGAFLETVCHVPPVDRGFVVYRAARLNPGGNIAEQIPLLAISPGGQAADLVRYAELRRIVQSAVEIFKLPPTQERLNQVRADLQSALDINPADPEALRLGVDFYKRFDEHKTASALLGVLVQTDPLNASLVAEMGHEQLAAGDSSGAEKSLLRSRELHPANPRVAEDLARIQVGRENYAAALPLLEESLKSDGQNSAVWFLQADTAAKLGDWARTENSLEHGLTVTPDQLARRTTLVRLYLDHHQGANALRHAVFVVNALPADPAIRAQYAEFLEELEKPVEALGVWRKVLEADPVMEKAQYRVARLLLDQGDIAGAVAAADAGVAVAPKAGRLYLIKAEAVERRGDFYEARRVLRRAATALEDAPLLMRLAEMEDTSGSSAARDYMRAANVLQKISPRPSDYRRVLVRGLEVSARDGDYESGSWFSTQLNALGETAAIWSDTRDRATPNGVWVPGGLDALAFMARGKTNTPPERFFQDYCRVVHSAVRPRDRKATDAYLEPIREHFRLVAALEALGQRDGHKVKIVLALQDKAARRRTEQFVNLLGWKMHANKKGVTLEAGEKASQAKRQETASALAIDEVGLQEALQEGRSYTVELTDDWAPLVIKEENWRNTFYPKQQFAGGFAEAVIHDPRLATIYVGFARLNPQTSAGVLSGIGLKRLAEKFADLFYEYSSSLAIENDRAAVPGGTAAELVWQKLAGADPRSPNRFFQALFEKDDGKLLAFYATLSQLDAEHQHFFTLNASRAGKFYDLLRETPEFALGISRDLRVNSFIEFLRGVPLDAEGDIDFPGSPEVWMVVKGHSDAAKAGRLSKKLTKVAAPDQEDEILIRLARTSYGAGRLKVSELDNFLSVARVDSHRSHPLDEQSALLLAQSFSLAQSLYPYFAVSDGT